MDAKLKPIRGTKMLVNISKCCSAAELLQVACSKFAAHDRSFDANGSWKLFYPDGTPVELLPESDELFQLDKYRDQLMKDFQRIVLYVAPGRCFCCNFSPGVIVT